MVTPQENEIEGIRPQRKRVDRYRWLLSIYPIYLSQKQQIHQEHDLKKKLWMDLVCKPD